MLLFLAHCLQSSLDALAKDSKVQSIGIALDPSNEASVESSVSTRLAAFASYSTPKLIEQSYTRCVQAAYTGVTATMLTL
jgi:hypothetical protein